MDLPIYPVIYPLKMVIFHSYVSLPEGIWCDLESLPRVAQELESDPGLDRKNEASPPWKQSTFASSAHHSSAPQDLTYKVGEAAM